MARTTKDTGTDLLAGMDDDTAAVTAGGDLLGEISEDDDAESWMPDNAGEGIQGTVLSRRLTKSDYTPDPIPVVVLGTETGKKRITAFHSVLRREIEDNDPQPGDLMAAKYFGKKSNKKGTGSYEHYRVVVRKGAGTPVDGTDKKVPF